MSHHIHFKVVTKNLSLIGLIKFYVNLNFL